MLLTVHYKKTHALIDLDPIEKRYFRKANIFLLTIVRQHPYCSALVLGVPSFTIYVSNEMFAIGVERLFG